MSPNQQVRSSCQSCGRFRVESKAAEFIAASGEGEGPCQCRNGRFRSLWVSRQTGKWRLSGLWNQQWTELSWGPRTVGCSSLLSVHTRYQITMPLWSQNPIVFLGQVKEVTPFLQSGVPRMSLGLVSLIIFKYMHVLLESQFTRINL